MKIKPRSNWKLVVAFGAALLTLLVVGGISYRYMVGSEEDVQWVQHTRETLGTLDSLLSAEASINSNIRGFALSGNDSYLASYQASVLRADQAEAAIRKLTTDNPVQQVRLTALESLATAKVKRAEVVIGLRRTEGLQGVANAFAGGEGQRLSDGVQAIVHDMQNEELRLLELRRAASSRSEEGSQRAAIFGSVLGLLIVSAAAWSARRDAGVRKAAERQVAQVEGRYRGLLEAAPDAMVVVNQGGEIVLSNLQAEKQFGYDSGELLGRQVTNIIPRGFAERLVADGTRSAAEALAQQIGKGIELSAKRKDGSEFPIEIMLSPLASDEGVLVTAAIRDITVHNRNEAKLLELARLDLLTGLPNRAVFAAAVQKAIAWARNGGPGFAVFYLDLDHFKDVNDTLGHPVGDALLKEVAQRLEANVRETDTVARFGGDEFAILATEIKEPADAGVLAAGLLEIFSEPFSVGGNQIRSGASIGIAVYGVDATGAEMLLSRADVALYRARRRAAAPTGSSPRRWMPTCAPGSPSGTTCATPSATADIPRLPAAGRGLHRPHRGRRGPGPLASSHARHDFSGRIHSGGRDERPDRRPRPLGPVGSLPPSRKMARGRHRPWRHGGEPVGAAVQDSARAREGCRRCLGGIGSPAGHARARDH